MSAPVLCPSGAFSVPDTSLTVVAVQPNVPMNLVKSVAETNELLDRHLSLSTRGSSEYKLDPRLVVWPESPMNFTYSYDKSFQELVANFARDNRTTLLFNSLEPAPERWLIQFSVAHK